MKIGKKWQEPLNEVIQYVNMKLGDGCIFIAGIKVVSYIC